MYGIDSADVVIVGGAAMGSSIACQLAMHPGFRGRIAVVEMDSSYARAPSALSAASIRQQFSSSINIAVSLHGIAVLRDLARRFDAEPGTVDIGLVEQGYLYLAQSADGAAVLAGNSALQNGAGADILHLDRTALAARFPWLAVDDISAANWGRTGEGWFDGWALLQFFKTQARRRGVFYLDDRAIGLERTGQRATGVQLASGGVISAGVIVNAAGAAGGRALAHMAGCAIPVFAKKRCVFSWTCPEPLLHCPLVVDPSGIWFRPEGEGFIGAFAPDDLDETDQFGDFDVHWPYWEDALWPALAARVPAFERVRPGRAWAGHYDMNLFDHNAIVGPVPGCENVILCNGFSGHGLQQSPAIGRGVAEWIVDGRYVTLDLSAFSPERLLTVRKIVEDNVI